MSGPWGIGKTTAIESFAAKPIDAIVVKVQPGGHKSGRTPAGVLVQIAEALARYIGVELRLQNQTSVYSMERIVFGLMRRWPSFFAYAGNSQDARLYPDEVDDIPPFTIVFDEAQHLSRHAIDYLRFWNDPDRTATPFPIGLAFIGNPEFSLDPHNGGESIISGAVRSRALFIESLEYSNLTFEDLLAFARSRGVDDDKAAERIARFYTKGSIATDLRNADRMIKIMARRAGDNPISDQIVRDILG